jgi:hypothetical protein
MPPTADVMGALTATGSPLVGASDDYDYFFELIGDARLGPLGRAMHATDEFYRERSQITKRLTALLGRRRHVDYLSMVTAARPGANPSQALEIHSGESAGKNSRTRAATAVPTG